MPLVRDQGAPLGGRDKPGGSLGTDPAGDLGPVRTCCKLRFPRCERREPVVAILGRNVPEARVLHGGLRIVDRSDDKTHAVVEPCRHLGRVRWRAAAPIAERTEPARDQHASNFGEQQGLFGDVNETVFAENDVKLRIRKRQYSRIDMKQSKPSGKTMLLRDGRSPVEDQTLDIDAGDVTCTKPV